MTSPSETRRLLTSDTEDETEHLEIRNGHASGSRRSSSYLTDSYSRRYSVMTSYRSPYKQYAAAVVILLIELAERMTYYGLICNLVLLITSELKYSSIEAVTINLIFSSVCYFMPVLGGFISDVCCGYFNTLYASGLMYIVGAATFPILTFQYEDYGQYGLSLGAKRGLFFLGLVLISLGTGGIKSNVGPFGAEQLENAGPNATQTFFTWFYWFINVGAFIAFAFIAYIQQEISFFVGFIIPSGVMILAVLILVTCQKIFTLRQPQGSVLPKIFHVISNAFSVRKHSILHVQHVLDYARRRNGGRYHDNDVDDVKALVHIIPIFLCCIMFWTVYNQMSSTFFLQAERMNVQIGSLNLPAASLSLFDALAVLVLAPVMDRLVYPLLDRVAKRPSQLVRMGIGMILASLAMVIGGVLEVYRKEDIQLNGAIDQVLADQHFNASNLSVFYQIPQFVLMGTGEIFLVITGQELAFSEAPVSLKSAVMGLFLITNGFGNLLGSALINLANAVTNPTWIPDDINNGYMDKYCFLLAGIMFANFLVFVLVARGYQYNNTSALHYRVEFSKNTDTASMLSDDETNFSRKKSRSRGILDA